MLLREGKPRVDMPDNPLAEMTQNESVLTSSGHWKGQYGAILSCEWKRVLHRAGCPIKISVMGKPTIYNLITPWRVPLTHQIPLWPHKSRRCWGWGSHGWYDLACEVEVVHDPLVHRDFHGMDGLRGAVHWIGGEICLGECNRRHQPQREGTVLQGPAPRGRIRKQDARSRVDREKCHSVPSGDWVRRTGNNRGNMDLARQQVWGCYSRQYKAAVLQVAIFPHPVTRRKRQVSRSHVILSTGTATPPSASNWWHWQHDSVFAQRNWEKAVTNT